MKILGISGSPRKGNTEWMLKTLLENAEGRGAETELILLRKAVVHMCRGCLTCAIGGKRRKGNCVIKDDMPEIYKKIKAADAIVMGTPVYFDMLTGLLKNFMDRTCPIWPKLKGKKMAAIAVAQSDIGEAVNNIKTYADMCRMEWTGSVTILAEKPDEAEQDSGIKNKLSRLSGKICKVKSE